MAMGGVALWTPPHVFGAARAVSGTRSYFTIVSVSFSVNKASYFVATATFYVERIVEFPSIQNGIAVDSPNIAFARAHKAV